MPVLIVEDEPELGQLISVHLEAAGYETVAVTTGEEALTQIATGAYDLVLLDLVLPGINGRAVLEGVRETYSRSELPVIVVSGLDASHTITGALRVGANDYVTKPINMDLLLARCATIVAATAPAAADRRALSALGDDDKTVPKPIGHCAACESTIHTNSSFCAHCGLARPDPGWPAVDTAEASYLGQMIDGRYFVDRLIARGGQGEVYKVLQTDLERIFAAKFVNIKRDRPERTEAVRARILGEIKALAKLQSPHVVRIHDVVQIDDTIFCLIMDFVNGRSVESELNERRKLPLGDVIDVCRQVSQGLVEAHEAGFVHRDIKPNNIMVEELPAGGRFVRILDFGFVHNLQRQRDLNRFEGTVGYSAPEQLTAAPIDHRADIYALGITLYDMATGAPPFAGKPEEVVDGHVYGPIPSLASKLGSAPDVVELDEVMQKMLAKRPEDRNRDLFEVIRAMDRIVEKHGLKPSR
ncbi:MAG: CheY-like chemotaxis protein/tRNA A-37 threonylcarbamoyl transferase component Bud32 [Bradymonadia bacterium]|jgi:CheY-like chemotaxis protein/tRNA A-37 threonylcarbamoyl transferase component Bud32